MICGHGFRATLRFVPDTVAATGISPPGPPLPLGRRVDLPGRGTTFAREIPAAPGMPTLLLLHGWMASGGLCLFMVDDTEFLDRFPLNPDRHGNCSANEDCPCHALPSKLPDGVYEAADPATSPSGLAALAGSDDLMVLRAVGANPSTPAEKLTGLGVPFPGNPAMGDVAVQRAVGANPSCPEETQVALAGERRTAAAVAGNPAVSAAAAGTILADPTAADAHRALAANPACPPEVLARIASDPAIHETARIAAAANPNCPKAARAAAGLLAN